MQTAHSPYQLMTRPQIQVIRIPQDDLRIQFFEYSLRNSLHRSLRSHRHKDRRLHRLVRQIETRPARPRSMLSNQFKS